jgi:predicted restriction endonuclease
MEIKDLRLGDSLTNGQIMDIFGVGNMGGMRRNAKSNTLVLLTKLSGYTDNKKLWQYGDRWQGDVLLYTGMGQQGDQTLTSQNRTVNESKRNGVIIHLFETHHSNSHIYSGIVELGDKPFQETQKGKDGIPRQVWIFPLRRVSEPSPIFVDIENEIEQGDDFNPNNIVDGRKKILTSIVRRRGQQKFRNSLLEAYQGKCAISGSELTELLDAAHITPYKGDETNDIRNGILLRTDIHTLFDLGLIAIDPDNWQVITAKRLATSHYSKLTGRRVRLPSNPKIRPSAEAFRAHRDYFKL